MKEISEEQQWMIFELLEGNLSETESEEAYNTIKNNPAMFQFYKELKLTYLVPDNSIVYNKKQELTKSTFSIYIRTTLKYAAVFSAFGILSWLFYFSKHNKINPQVSKSPNSIPKMEDQKKPEFQNDLKLVPNTENTALKYTKTVNIPREISAIKKELISNVTNIKADSTTKNIAFSFENSFLTQILENQYLSDEEKLSKILKWKRLNAPENTKPNEVEESNKVELVFTDFEQLEKDHQKQLRKLWLTEARNGLKYGKIPQVKLVSTKKENEWIPQVKLQLKANTTYINASLIQ